MTKLDRSIPSSPRRSLARQERPVPTVRSASGSIVRLTDPEMQPGVEALKKRLANDPAAARQWLQDLGFLTVSGNVTKRYAGR